jgi:peptidoglycan/xylan/chitin deacetylase (PgdA/CDA1 family)
MGEAVAMAGFLCLTCDNMGSAVEVGLGQRAGPDPSDPSLMTGYPRWLALLDSLGLSATFFIEGWNGLHHPRQVRELVDRGHEVGLHGWVHEAFAKLSAMEAERVLTDAGAAFRNLGLAPRGFRAPGGLRGAYAATLLEKQGLDYDSSVEDLRNEPMRPRIIGNDIVTIPWRVEAIDYFHFVSLSPPSSPEAVERTWNRMIDEAAETDGLVTFIFHAMTIGVEEQRLAMAERVLRRARAHPGIEVVRGDTLADRVRAANASSEGYSSKGVTTTREAIFQPSDVSR